MLEKAQFYYFYHNIYIEISKVLLVLVLLGFFVLQLLHGQLPKFPLFFLSLFVMFETFFHFGIAKSHPRILVSDDQSSNYYEMSTLEALFFAVHKQEVTKLLSLFLRTPQSKFFLEKAGIDSQEVPNVVVEKELLFQKAAELARSAMGKYITSMDILASYLLLSESSTHLLFAKELKEQDVLSILIWARTVFINEEQPPSVQVHFNGQGLGEGLVTGWTLETKEYTIDKTYTALDEMVSATGREKEFKQIVEGLKRGNNNNVLLVGEPGSGRRTLIYSLITKSMQGNLGSNFAHKRLYELLLDRLFAGTKDQGELASRLDAIIAEIAHAGNVMLFIPEFQTMAGAGTFAVNLTGVLLPYLEQGNLPIIATVTPGHYKEYIEPFVSLTNTFTIIKLTEPSLDVTMQMLMQKTAILEANHNVFISYKAVQQAVQLASKFSGDSVLPGSAANLLEETVVTLEGKSDTKKVLGRILVDSASIITKLEQKTNMPVGKPQNSEKQLLLHLEEVLHSRIAGQNAAVTGIAEAMRRLRTGLTSPKKPISFLFLGPTGVGKTETAKALADVYYGGEAQMIRLDMSEYTSMDGMKRLLGATPGEGDERGELTDKVHDHPFSLILLDEFEKAHPDILNLFLQVFEDGRLTDNKGKTVSFINTIIIATSNAASEFIREELDRSGGIDGVFQEKLLELLQARGIFKPELLNRFDAVIVFTPIDANQANVIIAHLLSGVAAKLLEKDVTLLFTKEVTQKIAHEGLDKDFGARPLKRYIQNNIEDLLATKLLQDEIKRGDTLTLSVSADNQFVFS